MWELLKLGAPRHPKEYSGIIRGIWEVSIEDPLEVVLRTSDFWGGSVLFIFLKVRNYDCNQNSREASK